MESKFGSAAVGAAAVFVTALLTAALSVINFPLFHVTVGLVTLVVGLTAALTLLMAGAPARRTHLAIMAVAYGWVAVIELLQLAADPAIGALRHSGPETIALLWAAGRFLEAVAILVAMLAVSRVIPFGRVVLVAGLYTAGVIAVTLVIPIVTDYVPVVAVSTLLTAFVFCAGALAARGARRLMDAKLARLIELAAWMGALAMVAAGFAVVAPREAIVVSHLARLGSVVLIAKALLEQTVRRPLRTAYAQALHASEVQELVLNRANAWLVGVDEEKKLTLWNKTAERWSGYGREELVDLRTLSRLLIADDEERARIEAAFNTLTPDNPRVVNLQTLVRSRSGQTRAVSWNLDMVCAPLSGDERFVGVGMDVTELEAARSALRTNEAMHRLLLENLQEGLWALDRDGRTLYVNAGAAQIVGMHAAQLAGRRFDELCPDFRGPVREPISMETALRRPDGTVGHVHISGRPITTESGETHGVLLSIIDRSEYRRINETNALLTQAVDHATESIYITDADGIIQFTNFAFTEITGFAREEAIGRSAGELHGGMQEPVFYERLWARLGDREEWQGVIANRRRDGTDYLEEVSVSPFFDEGGAIAGYIAVGRDTTQETRLREHMETTQRLEAIGTLAGGIAHDFNNILMAILGYAQIASASVPQESPVKGMLEKISAAGTRATRLADQVLTFSRGTIEELEPTNVHTVIDEALGLLQLSTPPSVTVETVIADDLPQVMVNPTQLVQVFLNLGVNAIHATETKASGRIEIRVSHRESLDDSSSPAVSQTDQIVVEIIDDGVGMDADVVSRLFEPFFTTKPVGKGTGMGLPVVHGIVTAAGGAVDVDSRPNEGTTIRVYLPAIEGAAEGASERSASAQEDSDSIPVSSGGTNE